MDQQTIADEPSLRRPDFRGGEPIILGDGQAWAFPKPSVVYRPTFVDGAVFAGMATSLGSSFDAALKEVDAYGDDGPPVPGRHFVDSLMALAVVMLRINYDLTDAQLGGLVEYKSDDEESQDTWVSILDVARGHGPKPTSVTTESP